MSSYRLKSARPEEVDCFVGYDPALDSFTVWVLTRTKADARGRVTEYGRALVLAGAGAVALPGQPAVIRTVEELALHVGDYGELSEAVKGKLRGDREREAGGGGKGIEARVES